MKKPAVVLCSGGLDSTTCLGIALAEGFDAISLSFDYGQRHRVELDAVVKVVLHYGVTKHFVFDVGLFRAIGGSALTTDITVPTHRGFQQISQGIPITYVPARNLVFLSYALGIAETSGARDIFIGVNAVDYSGYPDCRPEFIEQFERTANLATKAGVEGDTPFKIHAPLVGLTKADIVRWGVRIGVPYHLTHTCYNPSTEGISCGTCDACVLRKKGFQDAGLEDPISYISAA